MIKKIYRIDEEMEEEGIFLVDVIILDLDSKGLEFYIIFFEVIEKFYFFLVIILEIEFILVESVVIDLLIKEEESIKFFFEVMRLISKELDIDFLFFGLGSGEEVLFIVVLVNFIDVE